MTSETARLLASITDHEERASIAQAHMNSENPADRDVAGVLFHYHSNLADLERQRLARRPDVQPEAKRC
jgi:hypothetical protein